MSLGSRKLAAVIAVVGIVACFAAVLRFFLQWTGGRLELWPGFAGRDLYLAAGRGYGLGFVVGFFFAFFLVLLSLAIASWWEQRRALRRRRAEAVRKAAMVAIDVESGT